MRPYVGLSSALWKTAYQIRVPFGVIGRTGPGMRQVVVFGDRSMGRGTFGARHCNQWGLNGVCVRQCRDAASSRITLDRLVLTRFQDTTIRFKWPILLQ